MDEYSGKNLLRRLAWQVGFKPGANMEFLSGLLRWFSGGADQYHTLYHCMRGDTLWVTLTVVLDLTVACGYGIIALHWWKNQRNLPASPARNALRTMRNIFVFCCVCGYIFIPVKMFWPAWRLYDIALAVLAYYTWKYALNAKSLKVIYNELGRSERLEADLNQSREESQRKSFFLNALSHDLRTPLNGLVLQAQLVKMAGERNDPQAVEAAVLEIEAGARSAAELLDALLECARLDFLAEPQKASTFAVDQVLHGSINAVRARAGGKGLYLKCSCPQGLVIRTDRVKLERILANLIGNAVKFTNEGGVRVAGEYAGENLEIHVVDSGPGLSAEDQARVFDEFYQAQNSERDHCKGFGLGLAIARRLARQLGGDIDVQSEKGAGSRFSLLLPGVVLSDPSGINRRMEEPALAGQA